MSVTRPQLFFSCVANVVQILVPVLPTLLDTFFSMLGELGVEDVRLAKWSVFCCMERCRVVNWPAMPTLLSVADRLVSGDAVAALLQ